MGKQRAIEIAVGAFMAAGLIALFFLAMQVSNLSSASSGGGYLLEARFQSVGSLKARAPVSMGGVRIGRVAGIRFDQDSYEAVVSLRIEELFDRIPDDTFANIYTAGLLGEQYIGLDPGGSEVFLKEGDSLLHTQSALLLEPGIGQFMFSKAGDADVDK